MLTKFLLRSSIGKLLSIAPMGLKLWRKGRVALRPAKIEGLDQIKKIIARADAMEMPVQREKAEFASGVGYGAMEEKKPYAA